MQRAWRRMWDKNAKTGERKVVQWLIASAIMTAMATGYANPSGGTVVGGSGSIKGEGTTLVKVNQSSNKLAVNWNSFSVATGEKVQFNQPSSQAIALNRVIGSDPSAILGQITADGKVILINTRGVLFGKDAQINVGALTASTKDVQVADFMKDAYSLNGGGAAITNQGTIQAANGPVELWAAVVNNEGKIQASGVTAADGVIRLVGNSVNLKAGSSLAASGDLILKAGVDGSGVGTVAIDSGAKASGQNVLIFYNPVSYADAATKSDTSGNPYTSQVKVGPGGTLSAYMLVNNADNLKSVSSNLAGIYALSQSVDLGSGAFVPLGNFTGVFDGQNYKISNLKISSDAANVGLFSSAQNATLRNITLDSVSLAGGADTAYLGSLVGVASGSFIDHVTVSGKVAITGDTTGFGYASGIVGRSDSETVVQNSKNYADVTATGIQRHASGVVGMNYGGSTLFHSANYGKIASQGDQSYAGGLVAYNYNNSMVSKVANFGSVTGGVYDQDYVGGLVGSNWEGATVENSINFGTVSGGTNSNIGGLIGGNKAGVLFQSANKGLVTGQSRYIGGLVGVNYGEGLIDSSVNKGNVSGGSNSDIGGVVGHNVDSVIVNSANLGQVADNADVGTPAEPPLYDTNVRMDTHMGGTRNLGGLVGYSEGSILMNDVNSGAVTSSLAYSNVGGVIGLSAGDFLSGLGNSAAVTGTMNSNIGGIAGFAYVNSAVRDVVNSGDVTVSGLTTYTRSQNYGANSSSNVGGIVGWLYGTTNDGPSTFVTNAVNTGKISGSGWHLGGIAGFNTNYATIAQSSNAGAVTADSLYSYAGGIAGANCQASIFNSTNSGAITNQADYSYAGGIAGTNWSNAVIDGTINSGTVKDLGNGGNAGGIAGANGDGSVVSYSLNTGTVKGGQGAWSRTGGVVAWDYFSKVKSCYNWAPITASGGAIGKIVGQEQH
ncbi:MAG: filamentous hemagglutinin N-terminal domain-containing protein [Sporomusaceae bacterium]|nr:filamentous hemagglutinin N-terminal domain-containing protein [Sporomusaceae bacterium]